MRRSSYVVLVLLLLFLTYKCTRFYALHYSFNDIYAFLQMATSWLDGRPFMYDNIWGIHQKIHNYYTVLLWAPLIRAFGAYGVFVAQAALLMGVITLLNQRLEHSAPRWARWLVVFGLALGPVSFWLNDHPNIGWHTELSYLPFALFFALALSSQRSGWTWITGALVVLTKEDGAILAGLIVLCGLGIRQLYQQPQRSVWTLFTRRDFWLRAAGWAALFGLGMAWLSFLNRGGEPRLGNALATLAQASRTGAFWRQYALLLGQTFALLLPAGVVLALLTRYVESRQRSGLWILFLGGLAMLTALNIVQSALYYGQFMFSLVSLTWPPRFVLLWAFALAFLVLTLRSGFGTTLPVRRPGAVVWVAVFWLAQWPIVYTIRPDMPRRADLVNLIRLRPPADWNATFSRPEDIAALRRLAGALPPHSNVLAYDYAVPIFHRHYGIWPTGNHYRPADVAIIPTADPQGLTKIAAHAMPQPTTNQPVRRFVLGPYTLYATPAYERYVAQALTK